MALTPLQQLLHVLHEMYSDDGLEECYDIPISDVENDAPLPEALRAWADAGFPGVPARKDAEVESALDDVDDDEGAANVLRLIEEM